MAASNDSGEEGGFGHSTVLFIVPRAYRWVSQKQVPGTIYSSFFASSHLSLCRLFSFYLVCHNARLHGTMCWYGRYSAVRYGMVWYGMVWYHMVWYGMVRHGMVWYGMVLNGMVWYDAVRSGTVQYSAVQKGIAVQYVAQHGMARYNSTKLSTDSKHYARNTTHKQTPRT